MQGFGQPGAGPAPPMGYGAPTPPMAPIGYQQPPPPRRPPSSGSNSIIAIVVIVFAILSIIMMSISLAMPWYYHKFEVEAVGQNMEAENTYSFSGIEFEDPITGDTLKKSWDDEDLEDADNTRGVYSLTQVIVILGLVFVILLLIGAILALVRKGKLLAIIFGLLAFIFCLMAPIIFMGMHPGAINDDYENEYEGSGPWKTFMGSEEESSGSGILEVKTTQTWGPSTGWVMALLGFIFALLGFILTFGLPRAKPASPTRTLGPAPGYGTWPPQPGYSPPPPQPGYGPPPPGY